MTYIGISETLQTAMQRTYAQFIQKLDDIVWSDERDVFASSRPLVLNQVPWFCPPVSVWKAKEWAQARACEHEALRARIERILDKASESMGAEIVQSFQKLCQHYKNIASRYRVIVQACSD